MSKKRTADEARLPNLEPKSIAGPGGVRVRRLLELYEDSDHEDHVSSKEQSANKNIHRAIYDGLRDSGSKIEAIPNDGFNSEVEDLTNERSQGASDDSEDENSDDSFGEFGENQRSPEEEVEERLLQLHGQSLKLKVFVEDEDKEFTRWMTTIHVHCTVPRTGKLHVKGKEKIIGNVFGRYVKRDSIREEFRTHMSEPCAELSTIAYAIFDRYGRLQQEFREHVVRKGTGSWGIEMDSGELFVIEYMMIEREWRHKGVGKAMLDAIVQKSRSGGRDPSFTLVHPGWLAADFDHEPRGNPLPEQKTARMGAADGAIAFYRAFGFRRIGASNCFGLATDPNHPSHLIARNEDFNPPDLEYDEEREAISRDYQQGANRKEGEMSQLIQKKRPLHHAALTLSDDDCVQFFNTFHSEINQNRDEDCTDEETCWSQLDGKGNSVLHVAAIGKKPKSVQWLLAHKNTDTGMAKIRNLKGYTPLESLENKLEKMRTTFKHSRSKICVSDTFSGWPPEVTTCLAALQGNQEPTTTELKQLQFGCTCGQCSEGFLSPRMRFALLCRANLTLDMMSTDLEDEETWSESQFHYLVNALPGIQQELLTNKPLREGLIAILGHVVEILKSNQVPSEEYVLETMINLLKASSEWPVYAKEFWKQGAPVVVVLKDLFESTKDEGEYTGDGDHMELFGEDIEALPECRNDLEYGCVARACGLGNLSGQVEGA